MFCQKPRIKAMTNFRMKISHDFTVEHKVSFHLEYVCQICNLGIMNAEHLFSSPSSYYVWGTLVIVQIFDFRFLTDLHVLGLENPKNIKLAWRPGVR